MNKKTISKFHVFTKNLWQCFLVLLEFGMICVLFVLLTDKYILPCDNAIDYIERGTLGLAIYEFFVFITLNFINDAKQDELNALNTTYKLAVFACEENEDKISYIKGIISKQLDNGTMNSVKIRDEYKILLQLIENKNIEEIKLRQIMVEGNLSAATLQWKYTLILRLFK